MKTALNPVPANLEQIMANLVVTREPKGKYEKKYKLRVPQGPKKPPTFKAKKGTETIYTEEFITQVVSWLYDDLLTLRQIVDILNAHNMKSAHKKPFTTQILTGVLSSWEAWAIIHPRWVRWQHENMGLFA